MIRTIVVSCLLLVACSFVQSTWFGAIAVLGVIPDLSLVVLIWLSYKNGPVEGSVSGFVSGLADDVISAAPLGFHAFVKTAVASAASLLHGSFYIDRLVLPIVLGVVGTVIKAVATWVLSLLFGAKIHVYSPFGQVLWIEAAYNGLLAPAAFLLLNPIRRLMTTARERE
jgi:rod shape-determining protein MreD